METIQIERKGNVVAIKPDFGKRTLITFLNGRKKFGFKLNKNVSTKGGDVYSDEGEKIMTALRSFSREQLRTLGIKTIDGVWQTIELSKEEKK